jgi:hypothetical protein
MVQNCHQEMNYSITIYMRELYECILSSRRQCKKIIMNTGIYFHKYVAFSNVDICEGYTSHMNLT